MNVRSSENIVHNLKYWTSNTLGAYAFKHTLECSDEKLGTLTM